MINQKALYVFKIEAGEDHSDFDGFAVDFQEWNPGKKEYSPGEKCLAFHDTCRGHAIVGKVQELNDGTVILTRPYIKNEKEVFTFKPCTLEMFRRTYYKLAHNGEAIAEVCHTTDDLWEYYRRRLAEDFL